MKRTLLITAFAASLFMCQTQEIQKPFSLGLGVVGGTLFTSSEGTLHFESKTLSVGMNLQGEYRFTPIISAFASTNYNLLIFDNQFEDGDASATANFITV